MYELWAVLRAFFTSPEMNPMAQPFAGIVAFVLGWRFVIMMLGTLPVFSGGSRARVFVRAILSIGGAVFLGVSTAGAVAMLAQGP